MAWRRWNRPRPGQRRLVPVTDTSLAQPAHEPITRVELRRAIQERTTRGLLYRSGLLMSQCLHRLNPPRVSGEPFEERGVFPIGQKRPGERLLH